MRTFAVKKINSNVERQIITGMIVSTQFLSRISRGFKMEYLESPYARTLADWCLKYHKRYETAPGAHIQDIYNRHLTKGTVNSETSTMIHDLLESLSSDYSKANRFNVEYMLDLAEDRFKERSLEILKDRIEENLENGDTQEAEACLSRYKHVSRDTTDGINPFLDKDAVIQAFENDVEPLFTFPGALGEMMNEQLLRGCFIGVMAPEKRGKSWWLWEFALRAFKARNNVAFFELGDMSRSQTLRRLGMYLSRKSYMRRHCGRILIPVLDCIRNQEDTCHKKVRRSKIGTDGETFDKAPKTYHPCSVCEKNKWRGFKGTVWYKWREPIEPLTWQDALKAGRLFVKRAAGKKQFKLANQPSDTVTVSQIESQLDIWEKADGFVPDVIVIDYADIMAAENIKEGEERQKQNLIWKRLRSLSLKRNCLVITATQTDTASYTREVMDMDNFSEDKRKYGHVTAMLGLNQMDAEKEKGIMRLNWVVMREGDFDKRRTVKVLQCLQIGRPCLASYR